MPLGYFGGKSARGSDGNGKWVASLLPTNTATYVETHAGMLGVLLQRRRAHLEIANDLDNRIVDFWKALREEHGEMIRLVSYSEWSNAVYAEAQEVVGLSAEDWARVPLARRGWAVAVMLQLNLSSSLSDRSFKRAFAGKGTKAPAAFVSNLAQAVERIKRVEFLALPAHELLERLADKPDTLIYVDPPYGQAASTQDGKGAYGLWDQTDLTDCLLAQSGQVAISGYGTEWDHLGWRRHVYATISRGLGMGVSPFAMPRKDRTEVLWTNYETSMQPQLWSA